MNDVDRYVSYQQLVTIHGLKGFGHFLTMYKVNRIIATTAMKSLEIKKCRKKKKSLALTPN